MKIHPCCATRSWSPEPLASLLISGLLLFGMPGVAADSLTNEPILANLSFEQLSQIQVITASKRPEALASTPAAVYVLTDDDIHRLGVTTMPDALRYVPGMDVAMINSSQWGVAARGFNGQYANQLLVMMDGRSVYNPSFGGVNWRMPDAVLEDLERIEVVRGPGGTLWGANAVNGVINILTKSAKDTQGGLVKAGGGSFNEVITAARYGFKISEDTYARVYSKYDQFGETPAAQGGNSQDDWSRWRSGFRMDSQVDRNTAFTLQGDFQFVEANAVAPVPNLTPPNYGTLEQLRFHQLDANILGRWAREYSDDSSLSVQAYYDYFEDRNLAANQFLHTLDLDLQHNFIWGERQRINWGAGYRVTFDTLEAGQILSVPGRSQANDQLLSLFGQDEIAVVLEEVFLTLGTKLEHNDYTGWEVSPSARLRWQPTQRQTLWGAVSRAVTTPNHLSTGMAYNLRVVPPGGLGPGSPATLVQIQGQSDRVEELLAYEIGYRIQPIERVSVDVAAFYNEYSDLLVLENGAVIAGTPPVLPVNWVNRIDGHTHGVEVALGWQPLDYWRLQGSYTWFESDVARASVGRGDGAASPEHKFSLRSTVDLGAHWEWDTGLRYVSELTSVNVPAYLELDMRLAWKPTVNWEVALVGQNLLDKSHYEFPRGLSPLLSEVPRSVYLTVACRF